jgi:nicotinamidase-related amidase
MPALESAIGQRLNLPATRTALIVIDMQKGFDDSAWGARNNPLAECRVAQLIKVWREAAAPIVHVHHQSTSPAGSFRPGTRGIEPKAEAMPLGAEAVYVKRVNSAFIGTTLESDLRTRWIGSLIVVGLTTNHCVSTTVRMAGNLGFETYVVEDATATFDRAGADGRMRPANEVHNAALGDLHGEFAQVVTSSTVIASLRQPRAENGASQRSNSRGWEPPL